MRPGRGCRLEHGDGAGASGISPRASKAAPGMAFPRIAPWRDMLQAMGSAKPRGTIRDAGLARHRSLPRRHVPSGRCRRGAGGDRGQPPRHRRGGGARCGLPGDGRAAACRRDRRTSPARARWCADGLARHPADARAAGVTAGDRAAASDDLRRPRVRQHARPGARPLRGTGRRDGRRARRLSYLVGPDAGREMRARPRAASPPSMSATGWCRRPTWCSTAA